ncbi:DUF411 domain-containing protein [Arsukibacterium sp.]|jgi:hypothetical protein|uniref:DUF411 domain-containing protein n=1 Tax=Arsukibacterium sp. TaxID=1977258 RepID=UPI001BD319D4|nr:DUF411 domain-containing protein [Arsukibacterium sp.]
MKFSIWLLVKGTLIALLFIMTACSDASDPHTPKIVKDDSTPPPRIALTVFKSRTCGCCQKWITHAEDNGFDITANDVTFLSDLKEDKGIAPNYRSCHTAESKEGYVFEGHVPAKFIKQYLAKVPTNSIGLSVPAMPIGSPGMEMAERFMPYQILLLHANGSSTVYAEVATYEEQF